MIHIWARYRHSQKCAIQIDVTFTFTTEITSNGLEPKYRFTTDVASLATYNTGCLCWLKFVKILSIKISRWTTSKELASSVLTVYIHRHKAEERRQQIYQSSHTTVPDMLAPDSREPAVTTNSIISYHYLAVAAPHICNRLPTDVVAANSLSTFRRLLKRFLFRQSYPDIIYWLWHHPVSGPCSGCAT